MLGSVDFIQDVMNPILDDDPMASVVEIDSAVLTQEPGRQQVVTTHTMMSGIDFLPTTSSADVARRLLRIGLARLAARGAQTRDAVIVLALDSDSMGAWLKKFGEGLADDLSEFGVNLVAADVRSTRGSNVLNMTCIGDIAGAPLKAAGARAGDLLCVSGSLGAAAIGARLEAGEELGIPEFRLDRFLTAHRTPVPQWSVGVHLQSQALASACVNIGAGLLAAVNELAGASNVAASIELDTLPLADRDLPMGPQLSESADHQLLFSIAPDALTNLRQWFPQIEAIGRINAGSGVIFADASGAPVTMRSLFDPSADVGVGETDA